MNAGFRRLLALVAVFAAAFLAVFALRHWRTGGSWRDLLPFQKSAENFHPEKFTLAQEAPLDTSDVELLSRLNSEYARVTKAVVPSVVSIGTEGLRSERMFDTFGRPRTRYYPTQGQGSGVVVSHEGHVVTNYHVIAGQNTQIQVTFHDGKTYPATLVGEDTLLDIAVLKVDGVENARPLKFGDSSEVEVGQLVFAVGNPFGLGETVTQGIISAKERSISDNQRDLFQTDAAINPGNSGGPLVNLRGEIIGINAAIISADRENPGFQGVGFSIPSNEVKEAISQILKRGRQVRGFLGVQMVDFDARLRAYLKYPEGNGSIVGLVTPGSPAEAAGLQPKDVIQSYNGVAIRSMDQLFNLVQGTEVGEEVPIVVWRAGEVMNLKATISESGKVRATPTPAPPAKMPDVSAIIEAVGIHVRDLTPEERGSGLVGVFVTGSKGQAQGRVNAGDLIVALNGARVGSMADFYSNLAAAAAVQPSSLIVFRNGRPVELTIPAVARETDTSPQSR
jgi:serine protease Do